MRKLLFILIILGTSPFIFNGCTTSTDKEFKTVQTKACTIEITGMMCEKGCKTTIQNRINEMDGVISGEVDYPLSKAFVTYDASVLSCEDIISEIESIGDGGLYKAIKVEDKDVENAPIEMEGTNDAESVSVDTYSFEVPDITWFFSEIL